MLTHSQVPGIRTWASLRTHYCFYHSQPCGPQRFTPIPHLKCIHPIPTSSKVSVYYGSNSKCEISSKSHQLKSPKLHHLNHINQVWMRLWICSIWGKVPLYLWTCKTWKQFISSPNTMVGQSEDTKHRHPHSKRGTIEEKKESAIPRNFKILSGNFNKISSSENNPMWLIIQLHLRGGGGGGGRVQGSTLGVNLRFS